MRRASRANSVPLDTDAGYAGLIPVHRERPRLLKVTMGFELTKRFANKKLQKTIAQGGEIQASAWTNHDVARAFVRGRNGNVIWARSAAAED